MSIKVSLVIPIYNIALFIVDCLESIARQTYDNLEVIFVDDCGTDNSMQLLQKYLDTHSFPDYVVLRHELNKGLSAARNTGLKAASGDYIYFLDSDDFISERCIEVLVEPLQSKMYDMVVGSYQELHDSKQIIPRVMTAGKVTEPLKSYAEGKWPVMAWNKLCNRQFLLDNHLFFKEGILHEDVPWGFQSACECSSVYLLDEITYTYRIRTASIITSMSIEKDIQVYLTAFDIIIEYIKSRNLFFNPYAYSIVEGKKSYLLYSLLQNGEKELYTKYYPYFHRQKYISPWVSFRKKMINFSYFLRDFHYCLPVMWGAKWKQCFYFLVYSVWGRTVR